MHGEREILPPICCDWLREFTAQDRRVLLLDVFLAFKDPNFQERFMQLFPWPSWSKALD